MKKFTIILFMFFIVTSCKKEIAQDATQPGKISLADAVVVSSGNLTSNLQPKLNGMVKIYLQKDGRYVVGLEQMTINSNNDLSAYFSTASTISSNSIKLFSFKNIDGEMYYELPVNINVSFFRFLLIQDDISPLPTGIAELK